MPPPTTIRVRHFQATAETVIPEGERLAEAFFSLDPSSRGAQSYDELAGGQPRDRIVPSDRGVLNRSMRARSPGKWWPDLFGAGDLAWLHALRPSWDLIEMSQEAFDRQVEARLRDAFEGMIGPGRRLSVATKMLHFKRPKLVPILDSLVIAHLGTKETTGSKPRLVEQAVELTLHLRQEGLEMETELRAVKAHLDAHGIERPLVRILDALLWASNPDGLFQPLVGLISRWRAEDQG